MKKFNLFIGILISIGIMGMAGCGTDKSPITADIFADKMKEAGLEVKNQSEDTMAELGASEGKVAFEGENYQIEFVSFKQEEEAKSLYDMAQGKLEEAYKSETGTVKTSKSNGNYVSYKLSINDKYYVISRIGNTLVYSATNGDYKNQVKKLVEDLGY